MNEKECQLLLLPNEKRISYYKHNINDLVDIDFVYFDCEKSNARMPKFSQNYSEIEVLPLANYDNMFILNKYTYNKLVQIKATTELYLDSNVIIGSLKDNQRTEQYDAFFRDVENNDVMINCFPYILESACKDELSKKARIETYRKIKGFFIRTNIQEEDAIIKTDNAYSVFLKMCSEELLQETSKRQIAVSYLYFIKTFILKFKHVDEEAKIKELIDFINDEIFIYLELTTAICIDYLKNDNKSIYVDFFKKFQLSAKDIFKDIKGMSWDITLIYNIFREGMERAVRYNAVALPYFVTRDKGLASVIKNNKIKSVSIKDGKISNMYFENGLNTMDLKDEHKYSLSVNSDLRKRRFNELNIDELVKKYEEEIKMLLSNR